MRQKAAFVGLTTYDLIYVVDHLPCDDEKVVASDAVMNAGGPATNASVTFAHLGGEALLVSPVGRGPIAAAIRDDLRLCKVRHHDLAPDQEFSPPISSAFVTQSSGSRAVVSLNGSKISHTAAWVPEAVLYGCRLLLVDGHYMDAALDAAVWANSHHIPVVLDAGSWKAGTERLLEHCDMAIASSRFHPPGCGSKMEALRYLAAAGVGRIAITDGASPIVFQESGRSGSLSTFPSNGVDTTGAGDVFHGAFCYFLLEGLGFEEALVEASKVAARKCDHLGARSWLEEWPPPP